MVYVQPLYKKRAPNSMVRVAFSAVYAVVYLEWVKPIISLKVRCMAKYSLPGDEEDRVCRPCTLYPKGARTRSARPAMGSRSSPLSGFCGLVRQCRFVGGASEMRPCVSEGSRIAGVC